MNYGNLRKTAWEVLEGLLLMTDMPLCDEVVRRQLQCARRQVCSSKALLPSSSEASVNAAVQQEYLPVCKGAARLKLGRELPVKGPTVAVHGCHLRSLLDALGAEVVETQMVHKKRLPCQTAQAWVLLLPVELLGG